MNPVLRTVTVLLVSPTFLLAGCQDVLLPDSPRDASASENQISNLDRTCSLPTGALFNTSADETTLSDAYAEYGSVPASVASAQVVNDGWKYGTIYDDQGNPYQVRVHVQGGLGRYVEISRDGKLYSATTNQWQLTGDTWYLTYQTSDAYDAQGTQFSRSETYRGELLSIDVSPTGIVDSPSGLQSVGHRGSATTGTTGTSILQGVEGSSLGGLETQGKCWKEGLAWAADVAVVVGGLAALSAATGGMAVFVGIGVAGTFVRQVLSQGRFARCMQS